MDPTPIARRPFRVEPTFDHRRCFVTDASGRVVGRIELNARRGTWSAFVAHPSRQGGPRISGELTVTHIGTFAGQYGQADAVTAMESWFARRFSGIDREDDPA